MKNNSDTKQFFCKEIGYTFVFYGSRLRHGDHSAGADFTPLHSITHSLSHFVSGRSIEQMRPHRAKNAKILNMIP